ncbi:LysE family translocator [Musicola keenii]|uniref:LysE family translocator n=1 Tax=Musicola keenii TaxID=2884250 RepID=UPI001CE2F319|nr:LysE family transporter [Musicola keenii]
MTGYWHEFLSLALIHFLVVLSPGADFAVTVRQSVCYGRTTGLFTALGIGAGISIHVMYTLVGVSALMQASSWFLNVAKITGGGYLFYLGIKFITSQYSMTEDAFQEGNIINRPSGKKAFLSGFITNATNPKATLFFLAIFTSVVSTATPWFIQAGYGVWMCGVNALWFMLVSLLFSHSAVRAYFLSYGRWFEKLMGVMLLVFAVRLFMAMR